MSIANQVSTTAFISFLLSLFLHSTYEDTVDFTIEGYYTVQGRIVQGYNCDVDEYSYLVSILFGNKIFCGGSLIGSRLVLTAAHCCVKIKRLPNYSVTVGRRMLTGSYNQKSSIRGIVIHKDYSTNPLSSDICVVTLKDRIKTNENVKMIKLATSEEYRDLMANKMCGNATVMGFGDQQAKSLITSKAKNDSDYNPHVQCATVQVIGNCHDYLYGIITHTIICATDPTGEGRDACHGDSGGPLICNGLQIGVISAGFGCGIPTYPGLYCRVDIFEEFIEAAQANVLKLTAEEGTTGTTYSAYTRVLLFTLYSVFGHYNDIFL